VTEKMKGDVFSQEHNLNQEKKMLMLDGAIIGRPPQSEEQLNKFIHDWIEPTWKYEKFDNIEQGIVWLSRVANISQAEAIATLYDRNPRIYEQLAFSMWGNGYGETMKQFKTDLLKALQEAADKVAG